MQNCIHEKPDTRIVVHVLHALQQSMKSIKIRTVDTDVIVILITWCVLLPACCSPTYRYLGCFRKINAIIQSIKPLESLKQELFQHFMH